MVLKTIRIIYMSVPGPINTCMLVNIDDDIRIAIDVLFNLSKKVVNR